MINKLTFRFFTVAFFLVLRSSGSILFAQDTLLNKYGLWVISNAGEYSKTVAADHEKKMLSLNDVIPQLIVDLKYAGKDNFMHKNLYPPIHNAYLRRAASVALKAVQEELMKKNMGIKIWDAYRPYSVTENMWEQVKDHRYAANPKTGSGHNRGIAVDLTIIDLTTKAELDMGTGFDNFSDSAHHDFMKLPGKILQNRFMLRSMMEKHGFKALETEWWHYYFTGTKTYELLDLSFDALHRLQ